MIQLACSVLLSVYIIACIRNLYGHTCIRKYIRVAVLLIF